MKVVSYPCKEETICYRNPKFVTRVIFFPYSLHALSYARHLMGCKALCNFQFCCLGVENSWVYENFFFFLKMTFQITGEAAVVRKALYQIASRLHDNPSRSQHLLSSAVPNAYPSGGSLMGATAGAPVMGLTPLVGPYGGYKADSGDWSRSFYPAPRDDSSSKEFSIRLVCPTANIGGVIGKGGTIINQIRQESGAGIKVDSSAAEGDDCIILISAKEVLYFLPSLSFVV